MRKTRNKNLAWALALAGLICMVGIVACSNDPAPASTRPDNIAEYTLRIGTVEGGELDAVPDATIKKPVKVKAGDIITLHVEYDPDYRQAPVWDIVDSDGNDAGITLEEGDEPGSFTFIMPEKDITINVSFEMVEGIESYTISIDPNVSGGELQVNKATAAEGESVRITVIPNTRYVLIEDTLLVVTDSDEIINIESGAENIYTFVMPAEHVTVTAEFERDGTPPPIGDGDADGDGDGDNDSDSDKGDGYIYWPGHLPEGPEGGSSVPGGGNNNNEPVESGLIPGSAPYIHPDLVWSDEFDGDTLDMTKWNYDWAKGDQYGNGGWGNGEFQYYHPDNVSVKDGKLIIEVTQQEYCVCGQRHTVNYNDRNGNNIGSYTYGGYKSGKITTAGTKNLDGTSEPVKFMVTYGHRLEASIKVPRGRAFWPAFWGLGANVNEWNTGSGGKVMGWPRCGEIDIMETAGQRDKRYGVHLHAGMTYMDGYWNVGSSYDHPTSLADDFFVYGVKWDDKDMIFYLQNKEQTETIFEWSLNYDEREEIEARNHQGRPTAYTDTFYTQDFSIIFNFAISGAYVAGEFDPRLGDENGELVDNGTLPAAQQVATTWAVPPRPSAFQNTPEKYRDRTLQVDWVRVHRWNRDAE